MKRPHLFLPFLLAFILVLPVQAQTPRATTDRATLSFSGTTAHCSIQIRGNLNDDISATIKLWNGNQCLRTWQRSDTSMLSFYETVSVQKGQTYTLTANYTVAGKSQPSLSASGTC